MPKFIVAVACLATLSSTFRIKHQSTSKGASIWDAWVAGKLPLTYGFAVVDQNISGVNIINQPPSGAKWMPNMPNVNFKIMLQCPENQHALFWKSEMMKATHQEKLNGTWKEKMHGLRTNDLDIYYEDDVNSAFERMTDSRSKKSFALGSSVLPCRQLRIDVNQGITRTTEDVAMDRKQVIEELAQAGYTTQTMQQLAVNAYGQCSQTGHYVPGIMKLLASRGYKPETVDAAAKALQSMRWKQMDNNKFSMEQIEKDIAEGRNALVNQFGIQPRDCEFVAHIADAWSNRRFGDGLGDALALTRNQCAQEMVWGGALVKVEDLHVVSMVYYAHGAASTGGFSGIYHLAGGLVSVPDFTRGKPVTLAFELTQTCSFIGIPLLSSGQKSSEIQALRGNPYCYEGKKAMVVLKLTKDTDRSSMGGDMDGWQMGVYLRRS